MTTPARYSPPSLPACGEPRPRLPLLRMRPPRRALLLCCLVLCFLVLAPLACWAAPAARELLESGRADDALRLLRGSSAGPSAETDHYLCRVYYGLQDWDNALRYCERAVKLEPRNAIFQLWMGRSYGEKANVSNAVWAYPLARKTVAAFALAHQLDRSNMDIARDLAEYYTTAPAVVGGGNDKALTLAAEIAPAHPSDAAWVRAMAAASAGHHDEAEREFAEAIRLDHDSAGAYLDLAHYLRDRKSWDRFQQTVERAMQSPRIQPADRYNAAEMLLRTNRNLQGAARLMGAYIHGEHTQEQAPVFRAHYLLGEILLKLGDSAQAAAEYRAALSLANGYRPPMDALRRLGQR